MLRAVGRLLRQLGYASLPFPSAEAFANHYDFDGVVCVLLDINLGEGSGIEQRHRLKAAGIADLHECQRQPCRPHGGASIRVPRLSHHTMVVARQGPVEGATLRAVRATAPIEGISCGKFRGCSCRAGQNVKLCADRDEPSLRMKRWAKAVI